MAITTSINVLNQAKTYLDPGAASTCRANAAVVGRRFVKVAPGGVGNHPNVVHSGAGDPVYGVSHFDAAISSDVSVLRQGTFEVEAGAALTAGQEVAAGANGVAVVFATGVKAGVCLADTASGAGAPVTLYQ